MNIFVFGYYIELDGDIVVACSAALVSKKAVEVSIATKNNFRKKGLATIVCAKFILHCLEHGLIPHWDAANHKSLKLAEKLGYKYSSSYNILYLR
ncbi:GNAT family N-acetyltransferase [Clostridium cavendishii]|uniref:GNAT family N-acetyltransferase n=1 Tax=Clostridium cavendishii TaxID=349931 RepID=UPI0009FE5A1C